MRPLWKRVLPGLAWLMVTGFVVAGCNDHSVPGSPGVPEPVKVLENPQTGERVRFFREIWYKTPKGYDAEKHMAEWVAAKKREGYSREISPEEDRPAWAAVRAKARARVR